LRQRIFTASQAGDLKRVRSLQKLMLRSRSNTLVSVRRMTELNAGRRTAGVDGKAALTARGANEEVVVDSPVVAVRMAGNGDFLVPT
jgi:RNA-directed DNA polymerase